MRVASSAATTGSDGCRTLLTDTLFSGTLGTPPTACTPVGAPLLGNTFFEWKAGPRPYWSLKPSSSRLPFLACAFMTSPALACCSAAVSFRFPWQTLHFLRHASLMSVHRWQLHAPSRWLSSLWLMLRSGSATMRCEEDAAPDGTVEEDAPAPSTAAGEAWSAVLLSPAHCPAAGAGVLGAERAQDTDDGC